MYLSKDITDDRFQLCGGEGEDDNGFELWRNPFLRYSGGNRICKVGGFQQFMRFPRCDDEKQMLKHCSDWEQMLTKFGGALQGQPEELRILFLGILPTAIENKYEPKHEKYPTWQKIYAERKAKYETKRQQLVRDALYKGPKPKSIHAL